MSGWQRCDTCRKVRTGAEFDEGATTCRDCLAGPAPTVRKRASPVTTTRATRSPAAAPPAPPGPRRPLLGTVGSGDLEVRERRARRAAQEALAHSHPDEFRILLRDARLAEGLRDSDPGATPSEPSPTPPPPVAD